MPVTAATTTQQVQSALDRLNAGDESAREPLVAAACDRLRRLAHRMLAHYPGVRRWDETDDVLNAAVLRLCRAVEQVRPATAKDFLGLGALQIRRELIDLARRNAGPEGLGANHHSAGVSDGGPAVEAADGTHNPVDLAAWAEFHRRVDDLPDEEREVFHLLWYQEVTQPEAAEVLGVSLATLKRRWQAARLRLYDLLGGHLPA
jgi:RNA polymerase sigma factor (sigma-70 family)